MKINFGDDAFEAESEFLEYLRAAGYTMRVTTHQGHIGLAKIADHNPELVIFKKVNGEDSVPEKFQIRRNHLEEVKVL